MTEDLFKRELCYQAMISVCQSMIKKGIMGPEEFNEAEAFLNDKYKPVFRAV